MKITTVRRLLILLDLALVAGVGYSTWGAVETKRGISNWKDREWGRLKDRLGKINPKQTQAVRQVSHAWLVERGGDVLAARKRKKESPKQPEKTRVEAPKNPLEDLAEVVSIKSGPVAPYCYIVPKGQKDKTDIRLFFFQEGEAIHFVPGAVVKSIHARKVVCAFNGKDQTLLLKEGSPKTPASAAASGGSVKPLKNFVSGITTVPNSPRVNVSPGALLGMRDAGADEVLKGLVFSSVKLRNGKKAVHVKKVPQGSALYKGGLRGGDTVISINGTSVSTRAQIVSYVKSNPDLPRYEVVYIRGGVRQKKVVSPKR